MPNGGLPAAKLLVPSSGSTIQQSLAEAVLYRGVGVRRFLADDRQTGNDLREALGQHLLGQGVGDRDDVVGGLCLDLMLGERLVVGQDGLLRHVAQQVVHRLMEGHDVAHER